MIDRSKTFMKPRSWMGSNWYPYTRNHKTQIWVSSLQRLASLALCNLFIKLKAKSYLFRSKSQAIGGEEQPSELLICFPFLFSHSLFIKTIFFKSIFHSQRRAQRFPIYLLSHIRMLLLLLLSRFSHIRLCATPEMAAHQPPSSLGFSRQEHWSGLPFPSPMHESEKWKWSRIVSFIINNPTSKVPVTNDEIKLSKYNHPKYIAYIVVHAQVSVLYSLYVWKNV